MLHLRELERKDLRAVIKRSDRQELAALLGATPCHINMDTDTKWYEQYWGNRGDAIRCVITEDNDDEILGLASLVHVNYMDQSAEFHIMINNKQNQESGIEVFATNSMLYHAFNILNLQRVELSISEDNEQSKIFYEKCGFVYEGRKRKASYKNGKFVDKLMYSILRCEFLGKGLESNLPEYFMEIATRKADIDHIIRVCDKAFAEPVAERNIYPALLDKIHRKGIFVFAHSQHDIGYCAFYANDLDTENAYISLIAVSPDYQRLHVGQKLLNTCLDIAKDYGMRSCSLEVKRNNISAVKFYVANGFVLLSGNENSFFMTKELPSQKGKTDEYQRKKSYSSRNGETGL